MNKNYFLLLLSCFLISFASLFAKKINLPADVITWWRCLLSVVFLTPILIIINRWRVPQESLIWLVVSGSLFGVHWWLLFTSIQMTSVSIGVVVLFTFPLISSVLEPLYSGTEFSKRQIVSGIGILAGVYFLIPEFSFGNAKTSGVLYGLLSALCLAIRNVITRKKLVSIPTLPLLNYQVLFALIVLSMPLLYSKNEFPALSGTEFWHVCLLAIPFTVVAHGLITYSFKHFSATTVGILGGLQVVYSSFFAFLFLGEVPEASCYIGAAIVVSIAVYEMCPRKPKKRVI